MTFALTRDQLHSLVWSAPMKVLASELGISGVALAKRCRANNIPIPTQGYWSKARAGQKVGIVPLPPADLSTTRRIQLAGAVTPYLADLLNGEPGASTGDLEPISILAERFKTKLGKVKIFPSFERAHSSNANILKQDVKRRENYSKFPFDWNKPRSDDASDRRRLVILNAIFISLENFGCRCTARAYLSSEHYVQIGNGHIPLLLESNRSLTRRRSGSSHASGEASLCLFLPHGPLEVAYVTRWEDSPGRPLERQLTDIVLGLAIAAEHSYREREAEIDILLRQQNIAAEQAAREREEEAVAKRQADATAEAEAAVQRLHRDANDWAAAVKLREYIDEVVSVAILSMTQRDIERWEYWARGVADRLVPLVSGHSLLAVAGSGHGVEGDK